MKCPKRRFLNSWQATISKCPNYPASSRRSSSWIRCSLPLPTIKRQGASGLTLVVAGRICDFWRFIARESRAISSRGLWIAGIWPSRSTALFRTMAKWRVRESSPRCLKKMGATFKSAVISKSGGIFNQSSVRPRFRKQYEILQELSNVIFLQVNRELASGSSALDVKAWLLAECSVTVYINDKNGHWAPVFAILCDGNNFEFFVVDSAAQSVHSSGWVRGIPMKNDDRERTLLSIKRITEILFDFFIMAFINGLRSIAHSSTRIPTEISTNALTAAEHAHYLLRKANAHAIAQQWKEAEDMTSAGVERLNKSVRELSFRILRASWASISRPLQQ